LAAMSTIAITAYRPFVLSFTVHPPVALAFPVRWKAPVPVIGPPSRAAPSI